MLGAWQSPQLGLFPMPTNLKSNALTTANQTILPSGFDHAIESQYNTKNVERKLLRKHENYYLCKIKDNKVYKQFLEVYLPNVIDNARKECDHLWDTQLNESRNQSVAKYADKRKTFSKSMGLVNRVSCASATRNEGY